MQLDTMELMIPSEMLEVSGGVFYSTLESYSRPGPIYVLGANPGGDPLSGNEETIRQHLANCANRPGNWSSYLSPGWKSEGKCAPMQHRMKHLFDRIGVDPTTTPASNVVFVRSRSLSALPNRFLSYADACWPFHVAVIEKVQPKVILCLGNEAAKYVRDKIAPGVTALVRCENNERKWKWRAWTNAGGVTVVQLTHPSWADWRSQWADPSDFVREILARD